MSLLSLLHRLEEYVLQRVALVIEAANLHLALGGQPVEIADLDALGQDDLHPLPVAADGDLAPQRGHRGSERSVILLARAARLQLEKLLIGPSLLLDVAVGGDPSVLEH